MLPVYHNNGCARRGLLYNRGMSDDLFNNASHNRDDRNESANPYDVTAEDLAALKAEVDTFGEEESALAERLLRENLPMATMSIVKIAQNGSTDRVRLDAAKYIVERNMGRLQDVNPNAKKQPIEAFLEEMHDEWLETKAKASIAGTELYGDTSDGDT